MSKRLRVLQFANGELYGGAERQIVTLTRGLLDAGVSVEACVFFDRQLAKELRASGVAVRVLEPRRTLDLAVLPRLRSVVRSFGPDVVHIHGYRPMVTFAVARCEFQGEVVKTEHGMPEMSGAPLSDLRTRIYRWLDNAASRRTNAQMVYVTRELLERCVRDHAGLRRSVIYNGVRAGSMPRGARPAEYASDVLNVVAMGRLDRVKGFDVAVAAVGQLDPSIRVHLHVLGDGPERATLESQANASARSRVTIHGFHSNPFPFLAHADVLLISSRHEGLPFVLLEAWSLETAVVATRVGGLAEVIEDGETGLLLSPERPDLVAAAIRQFVGDISLRAKLVSGGARVVRARFDDRTMTSRYLEAYEEKAKTG